MCAFPKGVWHDPKHPKSIGPASIVPACRPHACAGNEWQIKRLICCSTFIRLFLRRFIWNPTLCFLPNFSSSEECNLGVAVLFCALRTYPITDCIRDINRMVDRVYDNHVHQHDGTHLMGGIADDAKRQARFITLIVLHNQQYDFQCGTSLSMNFLTFLKEEWIANQILSGLWSLLWPGCSASAGWTKLRMWKNA